MIGSLYIASLKEYVRDRLTLFWTLAFPVIFIVLFGLIFSGSGTTTYNVGLVNLDTGQTGTMITQVFASKDLKSLFNVSSGTTVADENSYQNRLKSGKLDLVIVIPPNLSQNAQAGQTTDVQLYYDSTKQPQGQILVGTVQSVLTQINQQVTGKLPLLRPQSVSVVTSTIRAIDYLVPGILAMSLMQLGLFGTVLPLVSLRERKILRRLGATPLPRSAMLISQVLLRLTISLFQTLLIIGIGAIFFGVQVQHPFQTIGVVALGSMMFISLGYLLAGTARTQESANGITQAINFPMLFLSGIFFPLNALPSFLTPIVRILPLTYLADAARQVMINSTPDFPIATDLLVMAGWIVVSTALALRFFKWE
jgi:ABC-2 type transport system permease protein